MDTSSVASREILEVAEEAAEGRLGLDRATQLAGRGSGNELNFSFEYDGFLFAVRATTAEQKTNVRFHAHLGNLPYTGESKHSRTDALAILWAAEPALGGRVRLTHRQRIIFTEEIWIDEPLTPVTLISCSARLLLRAKPYLAMLSEVVSPPTSSQLDA